MRYRDAVDGDAVDGDAVDGDAVDGDAVDGDAVERRLGRNAGWDTRSRATPSGVLG